MICRNVFPLILAAAFLAVTASACKQSASSPAAENAVSITPEIPGLSNEEAFDRLTGDTSVTEEDPVVIPETEPVED